MYVRVYATYGSSASACVHANIVCACICSNASVCVHANIDYYAGLHAYVCMYVRTCARMYACMYVQSAIL
jgi:hypothetical protein